MHAKLTPELAPTAMRARFWEKVDKRGPDDCWEWTRTLSHGYGHVSWVGGKVRASHRIAYALTHGDPGDFHVCHRCDNPPCCNPAHLFLGTDADNLADMCAKGRHGRGNRKLTEDDVRAVRAACDAGETQRKIGARFEISRSQVQRIALREQWGHVV